MVNIHRNSYFIEFILETLKLNTIINGTNNIYLSSMLMFIVSYISSILSLYSLKNISLLSLFQDINFFFTKYNKITIDGKRCVKNGPYSVRIDNLFGESFLALWKYINDSLEIRNDIYSIKEYSNGEGLYDDWGDKNREKENKQKVYIVNQCKKFVIDKDIYCSVKFENEDVENSNSKITSKNENIIIKLYSKKKSIKDLIYFVENITNKYLESLENSRLNKLFIYNYEGITDTSEYISRKHNKFIEWSECLFNSYRNFDNLFFDNKEVLIQKLDFFINNKEWYIKEGHPYTLGIGLSGSPGTGKTSIIKSIANKLKRHLIVISLNKIKTIRELSDCFFENQYSSKNKEGSIGFDKKIIVFEDIDCMCDIVYDRSIQKEALKPDIDKSDNMSTKDIVDAVVKGIKQDEIDFIEKSTTKKEDDKLTLSFVLNLIDGIRETPGRIMILTSNYYNKLDKALVRPGRIDITLELKNASRKTICDIYKHYYQEDIPQNILTRLKDDVLSPAELVNIKLNSYNNNDYLKKLSEKLDSIDDF